MDDGTILRNPDGSIIMDETESGDFGVTLFPDGNAARQSTKGHIEVVINNKASLGKQIEITSHELFGHAYLYVYTRGNLSRSTHDYQKTDYDHNEELQHRIKKSFEEIKQYK